MKSRLIPLLLLLLSIGCTSWQRIEPGVDYRVWVLDTGPIHVARIRVDRMQLIASGPDDRGSTVSEFAAKYGAVIAVNGDYFREDGTFEPVGFAADSCGTWAEPTVTRKEPVVAMGDRRVELLEQEEVARDWPAWTHGAVAGWPMLVRDCHALTSEELPGSDGFTRSDHPRTAIALSGDGATLYLAVAEGRSESASGMTLPDLGGFLREKLKVCRALNLDGGGSSEMVVRGRIVNHPSDGHERPVGNLIGVIPAGPPPPCTRSPSAP